MKTKIRKILSVCLILSLLAMLLPQTFVSAEEPLPPRGDMNGDGKIHADDARIALQAAARVIETTPALLRPGDVDNDGRISSSDARRILRAAAKLETLPGQAAEEPETDFNAVYGTFSGKLLQNLYKNGENILISPLSVMTALAMTENGAAGDTLEQFEKTFGVGADTMNTLLSAYLKNLPSSEKSRLVFADSLWIRENAFDALEKDFIDGNKDLYDAEVREAAFDNETVGQINDWCKENTDGMIDRLLDSIPEAAVMYLINALSFDAEWMDKYPPEQVGEREFTNADGSKVRVQMMYGEEGTLIDTDKAEGFMKPYYGGDYSFAAVLPKNGASADELAASLDGQALADLLKNTQRATVITAMPKFQSDYSNSLVDALKAMGVTDAFEAERADFSGMGKLRSGMPVFVSEVLHKTAITVNEQGTRAAAVTAVEMNEGAAMPTREIVLDRPFVYMIVDNATRLPIFLGVMNRMEPAPEQSETPEPSTKDETPRFEAFDGEKYVEIPLQLAFSHEETEDGLLIGDGIRMFSSVETIARQQKLPEITYSPAFAVKYQEPEGWETKVSLTVYRDIGDGALEALSDAEELSALPAGRYALDYSYGISRGENRSVSSAIFWLIVE